MTPTICMAVSGLPPAKLMRMPTGLSPNKVLAGERAIDDDDARVLQILIEVSEVAAFEEARSESLEVAGADGTKGNFVVLSGMLVTQDNKLGGAISIADGESAGDGRGGHAG